MKIGIYGLGRFGMFWAQLLSKDFDVYGYNRSPLSGVNEGISLVSEKELFQCDTVFLCVAISSIENVLKRIKPLVRPGMAVVDTCSVKVYPARLMNEILPRDVTVIGTHPMFGPDSGKNGVAGLPLVFSPIRGGEDLIGYWRKVFLKLNLDVIEISPEEHDREAAYTQGVTHFIGRVLKELSLRESRIATMGYRELLNIVEQTCNDPLQLFVDLQHYNSYTHEMRNNLALSIGKTMEMLKDADPLREDLPDDVPPPLT